MTARIAALWCHQCKHFLNMGQIRPLFRLFLSFSQSNINNNCNTIWKKRRWCIWDLNPGCRRNHWDMAATLKVCLPDRRHEAIFCWFIFIHIRFVKFNLPKAINQKTHHLTTDGTKIKLNLVETLFKSKSHWCVMWLKIRLDDVISWQNSKTTFITLSSKWW